MARGCHEGSVSRPDLQVHCNPSQIPRKSPRGCCRRADSEVRVEKRRRPQDGRLRVEGGEQGQRSEDGGRSAPRCAVKPQ